VPCRGTPPRA